MGITIVFCFLGVGLGWFIARSENKSLRIDVDRHSARADIMEESSNRKEREIRQLKRDAREFDEIKNELKDAVHQLTKERDEAREYAERYRDLYKQMVAEKEAKEVFHNFVGRTV
jgi:predicted transcriptional regulator